jgi:hypothetical protein
MPTNEAIAITLKRCFLEQALVYDEAAVQFIPTVPGVEIPNFLDASALVVFRYGLNQPRPIPDLKIDDAGIRATLAFGRQECMTFVPWAAVVTMSSPHFGIVFPTVETVTMPAASQEAAPAPAPCVSAAPTRPALALVP